MDGLFEHGFWFLLKSEFVFLVVIGVLLGFLLIVRSKISVGTDFIVDINKGVKRLKVKYGSRLFDVLSESGIYLPSACGGGGTCGMCKLQISDNTPKASLIDKSLLSKSQIDSGHRLACQLLVKQDLGLRIPSSVLEVKKRVFSVESIKQLTSLIYELKLKPDELDMFEFEPGDYIQVEYQKDGEIYTRGYSMVNSSLEKDFILLNIRLAVPPRPSLPVGVVSSFLTSRSPGDKIQITGPYGEFHINESNAPMVYVAGGVGLSGIRAHIFELLKAQNTDRKIYFWYGVRIIKDGYYLEEFEDMARSHPNFSFNLVLSNQIADKISGRNFNIYTGFVHEALYQNMLKDDLCAREYEYYFCGPTLMNKGMLQLLKDLGVSRSKIYFDDFG